MASYTKEQVEAKAAEYEAKGDTAAAAKLRAYAQTLAAPDAAPKYTPDQVEAKAAEYEAKGEVEKAAKLRDYIKTIAPAPVADTSPRDPLNPDLPAPDPNDILGNLSLGGSVAQEMTQALNAPPASPEQALAAFEAANPRLVGRFKPGDALPKPGDRVMISSGKGPQPYTVQSQPPESDPFGDTAAEMASGPYNAAKAFGAGLVGQGESPTRQFLDNAPDMQWLPGPAKWAASKIGDLGGGALSLLGAGIEGGIGLATELVPGQDAGDERKLGGDLSAMSMFAVPELAGLSSAGSIAATLPRAAETVATAAPKVAKAAMTTDEALVLARKAGAGDKAAMKSLAEEARINPDAKAAADRLGIELPSDVFSDSAQIKEAAGLTRSIAGSEASAAWREGVTAAIDKADEVIKSLGGEDISLLSEKVKGNLNAARDDLQGQSDLIYSAIDEAIPANAPVQLNSLQAVLDERLAGFGGKVEDLTGIEREIYSRLTSGDVTYQWLAEKKRAIGKAGSAFNNPFPDADKAVLDRLYGALSDDQMANVAQIGGPEMAKNLELAKGLVAQRKAIEDNLVAAFGKDGNGSIAGKLRSAVTSGAKGDASGFNKTLELVPPELRGEAVANALATATRSARSAEPGFGFAEFAKTYGGIKANKAVMDVITSNLSPEAVGVLDDLYTISSRITEARGNVLQTGKANQALLKTDLAGNLIEKILSTETGKKASKVAVAGASTAAAGPIGAIATAPLVNALTKTPAEQLAQAGKLFQSEAFTAATNELASTGAVTAATKKRLMSDPAFKTWAATAGLREPEVWFNAATQSAANTNDQPDDFEQLYGRY